MEAIADNVSSLMDRISDLVAVKRRQFYLWTLMRRERHLSESIKSLPAIAAKEAEQTKARCEDSISRIKANAEERIRMIEHRKQVVHLELMHDLEETRRKLGRANV